MQRKFITNLVFLIGLNLLVKPIWIFVFDREVQNVLGDDYGLYFAVLNFSFLFNILPDLGINQFNTRNIARNRQLLDKHVPALITTKFLLGLVYIGFIFGLGMVIGYEEEHFDLLLWLALNQFLISMIQYFRSNLQGLLLFKQDSVISVLDRALMMVMCGALLWGGIGGVQFDIRWFVWLQTAAYGLTALIALGLVLRQIEKVRFRFRKAFSWMIIRKSLPFALLFVLMSLYSRVDSVMLERLVEDGKRETGIYAQGYRILDAVNMFAMLFATLLMPIFARMLKERKPVVGLVQLSYKILLAISVSSAVICFFYSKELMQIMYDNNANESAPVFAILMFGFIAMSTTYVFGALLTADHKLRALNMMALASALLNVVLNLILIPMYGAWGAAVATLSTQGVAAATQIFLALYYFKFKVQWCYVRSSIIFIMGIGILGYVSTLLHTDWRINIGALLIATVAWVFLTRMIDLRQLFTVLKSREE